MGSKETKRTIYGRKLRGNPFHVQGGSIMLAVKEVPAQPPKIHARKKKSNR
jgi:hypothetical protein